MVTKQKLQKQLLELRERLLPFYEDDEEMLDQDIELKKKGDIGGSGLMSAISWCHEELGWYLERQNVNEIRERLAIRS